MFYRYHIGLFKVAKNIQKFTVVETIIKLILFILVVRFLIVVPLSCKRKADSLESIEESLVMISEQNKNTKSMNDELQK